MKIRSLSKAEYRANRSGLWEVCGDALAISMASPPSLTSQRHSEGVIKATPELTTTGVSSPVAIFTGAG